MDYIINNNKTQLSSNNNQPYNKKDNYAYDYYINGKIHIIVALSSLILGIVLMLLFWYNQNHYLIRYRGFKSAYVVGTVCFLNVFLVPIFFYNGLPCYTNFIVNSVCSAIAMILINSRYLKYIILNKQNLMKSNFLDINLKNKTETEKSQHNSNSNNENNKQVYFIIEPNEYLRHYNDIITVKATNIISISFFAIIFFLVICVFIFAWDALWDKCKSDSSWKVFLPIMVTTFISSLFTAYCLIYSLKNLSWEKTLDISLCALGVFSAILLYLLSKYGIIDGNGSSYFFFIPYCFCVIVCIIFPLIEIYWNRYITKKKKVSKTEFITLLASKKYIEIMKMYSIKYLCVENILFWELHMKILKTICSNIYEEVKLIKRLEHETQKSDDYNEMNNRKFVTLNDIDKSTTIMKTVECGESYNESSTIRKNSAIEPEIRRYSAIETEVRRYSTGVIRNKSFAEDKVVGSQPFPQFVSEFSGETIHEKSEDNEAPTYFNTLIMENSYNVNIFNISNSSNIYESESTELSVKNSQSIDIKLNIESSNIKRIIFNQIFKELVIPEEYWNTMLKKMLSFNDNYMEYYKKMYDMYINPKGIVPMKLSNNSTRNIGAKIAKSEYSYDMFFPILDEVANLIYEHVYLNLDI